MVDLDKLLTLRRKIDKIDNEILNLILQRLELVKKVSNEKQKRNIPVVDPERESQILTNITKMAKMKGYDEGSIEKIFKIIINSAKEFEQKLVNKS